MGAGKIMAPAIHQLAVGVVDKQVIMGLVRQQEYPSFPVLYHFMAVIHRVSLGIAFAPGGVQGIQHSIVAICFLEGFSQEIFCQDDPG